MHPMRSGHILQYGWLQRLYALLQENDRPQDRLDLLHRLSKGPEAKQGTNQVRLITVEQRNSSLWSPHSGTPYF